jgi:hypothetical protein
MGTATATRLQAEVQEQTLQTLTEIEQQIRELAYKKWEEAGSPPSDGVQFWLEAEAELTPTK